MRRKILYPLVLLAALALVCSCVESQRSAAYKSLAASKATYDSLLTSAGQLYKDGLLTDIEKDNIIRAGTTYKQLHNAAVGSLLQFESSGDIEDQELYLYNLSISAAGLANLIEIIKPFLKEKKDE